ncbi:MAG: DUF6599 family protein [candidate division KSB1 bacterium]|jgi:hypothetical protein|nr:DUF6599 family protein [candidate division KSB1 bacterium]
MNKYFALLILLCCLPSYGNAGDQIIFPDDQFQRGWLKSGPEQSYIKNDLYGYINGGAELFYEFGFERLDLQEYRHQSRELVLELYTMESPESALGIYLMKRGDETPDSLVAARNSSVAQQIMAVKGNYFIIVNNLSGDVDNYNAMRRLVNQVAGNVPDAVETTLLSALPAADRVPNSEMIVRGPYALQPVYTFGDGDIFMLGGSVFGVLADYCQPESDDTYTRLIIDYPDSVSGAAAFNNLIENLDSYLTMLEKTSDGLIFSDYRDEFGLVELENKRIDIRVRLVDRPKMD